MTPKPFVLSLSRTWSATNVAFYAYMLRCADNSLYTGHTDNLEMRLNQHVEPGMRTYTSQRLPFSLVWSEEFPTRLGALQAERQIKGWSRAKKEALIHGDWPEISRLAKSRPSTGSGRTKLRTRLPSSTVHPEPVEGRGTPDRPGSTLCP
jgi:predicted GIY-YIG superfamily endonuclease